MVAVARNQLEISFYAEARYQHVDGGSWSHASAPQLLVGNRGSAGATPTHQIGARKTRQHLVDRAKHPGLAEALEHLHEHQITDDQLGRAKSGAKLADLRRNVSAQVID
jgi:hypothetical protein